MGQHDGSAGPAGPAGLTVVHLVLWPSKLYIIDPSIDRFQMPVDNGDSSVQSPLRVSHWLLGFAKVDNDYVITSR